MNKTILITGANGFVGHHLVRELSTGYNIISTGREASTALAQYIFKHYTLDLTDPSAVQQIDFTQIDGVIHLAGLAAVGPSFDAPLDYININMGMEVNLYEAARKQKATPRFIIISSGSLYDATTPMPITELSPVKPSSPYAVSKLGQEQLATYYGNRGFEFIIARPFNHIGPGQSSGFILPDLAKQVVDIENKKAETVNVGRLDTERDYTDVRDIARAYRLLYEKGVSGETYNVCSGTPTSGQRLLDMLLKITGVNAPVEKNPALIRPVETLAIYGDSSKLAKDTGWRPTIPLEQTVTDAVTDWRSR